MPEGGPNPFDCVWKEPAGHRGENLSTFEMDLRDWGMTFGLAYFESPAKAGLSSSRRRVRERVREAARVS